MVSEAQKTMKLSMIYENRPQGPPHGHFKIGLFGPILTWKNFKAKKENFDDQRGG
jgi:hypothetical protein